MQVLVTAGPTREYIDTVRFITNASSGRMGWAVADAALHAGHDVTLLCGDAVRPHAPDRTLPCEVVPFLSVADLKAAVESRFDRCDALVMAAAPGDFHPQRALIGKLRRRDGPITIRLLPTEDILAGLRDRKRPDQIIVAFAVEDGRPDEVEAKARDEMACKGSDYVVVNTPAAMSAAQSDACILSPAGIALPWAKRPKEALAANIIELIEATQ